MLGPGMRATIKVLVFVSFQLTLDWSDLQRCDTTVNFGLLRELSMLGPGMRATHTITVFVPFFSLH